MSVVKILNPGSVLNISQITVMVVGYLIDRKEDKLVIKYVAIPYPAGYTSPESLVAFPYNADAIIIYDAPNREESSGYISFLKNTIIASDHITATQFDKVLKENFMRDDNEE